MFSHTVGSLFILMPFSLAMQKLFNLMRSHLFILSFMLERMWRKGNPSTLLVGMQTGAATVENSMEVPQESKNGIAF